MRKKIINTLTKRSTLKQSVYDNVLEVFSLIKEILKKIENNYNSSLQGQDKRILLKFSERGLYDCQLKVGSEILIFSMHTNVFQFNREHIIWQHSYVKENPQNAYSGIISIYNFLADSFKYNRYQDFGYLVTRLFVNREKHFMVEGKRQAGFVRRDFATSVVNEKEITQIIETAINYSLNFDLLVPPYDHVKIASVAQMHEKVKDSNLKTAKRLGFQFKSDDVT